MYKFADNQISFEDFGQPKGMTMNPNNRWVKKAEAIPWAEIEQRYAKLFTNKKGNVAKPLRLALGACIIQAEYGFSDEEVTLQIQEGPYLQFFCGFPAYKDERPFDPSLMVYFRKRLTPAILGEINELIIARNSAKPSASTPDDRDDRPSPPTDNDDPDGHNEPENSGTLIVDATCAPSQIRYPQDASLLNEAREKAEQMIDALHEKGQPKPRTYRKKAHKEYVRFAKTKKKTAAKIRQAIGKQLGYLGRDLNYIEDMLHRGGRLTPRQEQRLAVLWQVYHQQKYMFDHHTHSVEDRIVSLSQPWLRPIVRGKARSPVEFGAKLDISVADGWTRLEAQSFDAYNESGNLKEIIERYRERTGHYPERVLADKIYRNRDNLGFCKEHGIRLSGPALGRPGKDEAKVRKQAYQDACDRIEVERRFSLAKRKCGLGLITTRLAETVCHSIAMSVIVLNLRALFFALSAAVARWSQFLRYWVYGYALWTRMGVVQ